MPAVITTFQDLDLDFTPHPVSGDIIPLKDADAVKRSVRNLILTSVYERLFQPKLGSGVTQLLFEPINPSTQIALEGAIKDVLKKHERRCTIISVVAKVNADENGYDVTLTFAIDKISEILTVDMFLERGR